MRAGQGAGWTHSSPPKGGGGAKDLMEDTKMDITFLPLQVKVPVASFPKDFKLIHTRKVFADTCK